MIKAIETLYKGYRFRSRLEARWAVFFDRLGIRWEYEKQGYIIDGMPYLPDFWLPLPRLGWRVNPYPGHWLEVKGEAPSAEEMRLLQGLVCSTRSPAYLCSGSIGEGAIYTNLHTPLPGESVFPDSALIVPVYSWEQEDIDPLWQLFFLVISTTSSDAVLCDPWPPIRKAITAARSARFEYGETPR